jgi:hypothetical protein
MTTIPEMDDLFDFDAAEAGMAAQHPSQSSQTQDGFLDLEDLSSSFDMNKFLSPEMENDRDSFNILQHFITGLAGPTDLPGTLQGPAASAVAITTADDFNDFSRWIDGAHKPKDPCDFCRSRRLECLVIQKDADADGSCTSCFALRHHCSLGRTKMLDPHDALSPAQTFPSVAEDTSPEATSVSPHDMFNGSNSGPWLTRELSNAGDHGDPSAARIGSRFPRDSVRILKEWLTTHHRHPYPTDEEKEQLRAQTGLNKTQITNWLANARRRNKGRTPGAVSPKGNMASRPMKVPKRSAPALENMNPLERWQHSPPEHEPVSASVLARASTSSTFSSDLTGPYGYPRSEDGSAHSIIRASSTSSLASESSGRSFASAYSHQSRGSIGSFNSFAKKGRRRRRQAPRAGMTNTSTTPRQFQCTFCIESFRTKHDWQRHEKSIHLSLERWVCAPEGGTFYCAESAQISCVFCGAAKPDQAHLESHNYQSCLERTPEERTFYRKDHLNQHLRLVHGCQFVSWSMKNWKVEVPEIKSKCGFCALIMDTWAARVDHLAEHFKGNLTMADWRGDWGFEPHVAGMVDSGIPPCKSPCASLTRYHDQHGEYQYSNSSQI